ncbi:MAG: glutamate--tRNA ligase [Desulfovibrionaceae bacterium]|nr:glutamate--tRNA ligase [Desulfovibrionaceae bacterium]
MSKIITRFAPSPTGHLHIGGARTALFSWLLARHYGGEFRLRIEDTDLERSRQEYTDSILASMRWLGLDWDGDLAYQTKRTELYNAAVDRLLENGTAYWCTCTPDEVDAMREAAKAKGEKPRYDGRCRDKHHGPAQGAVVRLNVNAVMPAGSRVAFDDMVKGHVAVSVDELDDMVLRRSDGMPTYNMAVVVDDHDMGVTHVIRGDDHVSNTPKQILLYKALGWPLPVFGHVPMILGPDRQKLSKRHGARAVVEYQKDGLLPGALVNCLARLGWSHGDQEIFTMDELIRFFDGTNLNSSAAAFDFERLNWLNAHYLHETPADTLAELVAPFVAERGMEPAPDALARFIPLYHERAKTLIELADSIVRLMKSADKLDYDEKAVAKALTEEGRGHVRALHSLFASLPSFDAETLNTALNAYVNDNGFKFKQVGPALRVALLGIQNGPHLPDLMAALGRDATLKRMERACAVSTPAA